MKKIYSVLLLVFFISNTLFAANETFIVVIDAGHGGKDGGAVRGAYKEKEINLGVALILGKLIESNMKDVKVVYTRKSDVFVDLYKRADIANKAKANLFISIHTNSTASTVTTASGADTYILGLARSEENLAVAKRENSVIMLEDDYSKRYEGFDPNSPESNILFEFMTNKYMDQSLEFASNVQNGFATTAKRVDRGVAQAGFLVLRESGMPSVLIELGFINNPTEAKFLISSIGQRNMASAIYSGFEKYKMNFDKKQGKSSSSTTTVVEEKPKREVVVKPSVEVIDVVETVEQPVKTITIASNDKPQYYLKNSEPSPTLTNEPSNKETVKKTEPKKKEETTPTVAKTKTVAKVEDKKVVESETTKPQTKGVFEYRVQFLSSTSKLANNSPSFKGLSPIDVYEDGNLYKYTYGATTSEIDVQKLQRKARTLFKDAFVVKFVDGVRVK